MIVTTMTSPIMGKIAPLGMSTRHKTLHSHNLKRVSMVPEKGEMFAGLVHPNEKALKYLL